MASTLKINNLDTASGTEITVVSGKTIKAPGMVVQTLQFTASEQTVSAGSGTTVINGTFNPKISGSKFAVWASVPNCTATSGGSVIVQSRLGTNSSPNSNTLIIDVHDRMEGTGADDVRGINGHDFGSFTCTGTGTHYASIVITPDNNTVVGRHSTIVKLLVQEIAQ